MRTAKVFLSPSVLLISVWAVVLFLSRLPVIDYPTIDSVVLWFIGASIGVFCFGYFWGLVVSRIVIHGSKADLDNPNSTAVVIAFCLFLGIIGALMISFDFLFLRAIDYSEGLGAARQQNIVFVQGRGLGGGLVSMLGRILSSFGIFGSLVYFVYYEYLRRRLSTALFVCILLVFVVSEIVQGGRNTIFIVGVMYLCGGLLRHLRSLRAFPISRMNYSILKLLLVSFLLYFMWIFVARYRALGVDRELAIYAMESSFRLEFFPFVADMAIETSSSLIVGIAGLWLYITHSINELSMLLASFQESNTAGGNYNFHLLVLGLSRLGFNVAVFDPTQFLDRVGVYVSLLGDLFIDFGYYGTLVFMACLGFVGGILRVYVVRRRSIFADVLFIFICVMIIASPFYSILPNALGILLALVSTALAYSVFLMLAKLSRPDPVRKG